MLTPDGNKYDPVDPALIAECWVDSTSFPNLVKFSADASKTAYVDDFIIAACAVINSMCNRKFNTQQIDQVFIGSGLSFIDYKTFSLDNRPLISVDNAWVQVADTFAEIDLTYLQVATKESVVKLLPDYALSVSTLLPSPQTTPGSNIWIRYTSGYALDEVPWPVKHATALYVSYLFDSFTVESGIHEFKTQTYSQRNITDVKKDPLLLRIAELLRPYLINRVVA